MARQELPAPASTLATALTTWFAAHRRDLPWRTTTDGGRDGPRDAYRVWLAEIMLQQTRVNVVEGYFARFVARFPDVRDLAAAAEDDVLSLWSGLGYYARGRNLHKAARAVVDLHGGRFPTTSQALRALPGVGDYTAAAVASFAFGERVAVLDGNVARVLARLCDDDSAVDGPAGKQRFTALAQQLVEAAPSSSAVNEGLMELGALVCTPKSPSCASCPWSSSCAGRERAHLLPVKAKKQARKALRVACVVVVDGAGQRVWLERRASKGLFGGLWEPPGVIVDGDAVEAGWRQALSERSLDAPAAFGAPIVVERTLTHRDLRFEVALVQATTTPRATTTTTAGQWFSDVEIGAVGTSTAVRAVLQAARAPRLF
jgi:A/G-specific adenine glycosylase